MIKIIDKEIESSEILNREIASYPEYEGTVKEIIADVSQNGDAALYKYCERFDGAKLSSLIVSEEEFEEAFSLVDSDFIKILEKAKENIEFYHKHQLRQGFRIEKDNGIVLGQKITPIEKAGIYVPGGTASYPSTVLMNALPAKIAGVKRIVMTTPPLKGSGKIKPEILVAAKLCGVDTVIKCGGAQAIASLAYGTESVPKVDKIVGPGNIFVALAKKQVFGMVSIDMIAGPSEILVIADGTCDKVQVASDLLSQAEHDKLASAIMITTSMELAEKTKAEIERQSASLSRKDIISESLKNYGGIIVCDDMDTAVEIANKIAPEHLEVVAENPPEYIGKLDNVGSLFLGQYSPEPLGDYYAGPNHVLPTSGTARFYSPLGVESFVKRSSYIYYTKDALLDAADDIILIAEREQLTAHANSIKVRKEEQ